MKLELEKYQKIIKRNGDFQKQYLFYKKNFEPLKNKYESLFKHTELLQNIFEELINIYQKNLLLNSNFSNVKISVIEKTNLINQTRILLNKHQEIKMPDFYTASEIPKDDIFNKEKFINPTKKDFELKTFVVKKNKI